MVGGDVLGVVVVVVGGIETLVVEVEMEDVGVSDDELDEEAEEDVEAEALTEFPVPNGTL